MSTPGLGFQEFLLIAVLLLVFVRPDEVPVIFRKVGKVWAKIYYYYTMAKRELHSMEKEIGIEDEMKEIRKINARMNSEIANFDKVFTDQDGPPQKPSADQNKIIDETNSKEI